MRAATCTASPAARSGITSPQCDGIGTASPACSSAAILSSLSAEYTAFIRPSSVADPHPEAGRWLPGAARNAPCGEQKRRQTDEGRLHLCRGEGQAARLSRLIDLARPHTEFFAKYALS